ncbi:MAG: hypothetical protein ABI435_08835 [Pseudolysinimonas sp.]
MRRATPAFLFATITASVLLAGCGGAGSGAPAGVSYGVGGPVAANIPSCSEDWLLANRGHEWVDVTEVPDSVFLEVGDPVCGERGSDDYLVLYYDGGETLAAKLRAGLASRGLIDDGAGTFVNDELTVHIPILVGSAADLAPSTIVEPVSVDING